MASRRLPCIFTSLAAGMALALGSSRGLAAMEHDRSTPREAVLALLDAAEHDDAPGLAAAFGVTASAAPETRQRAAELGRELAEVLKKSPRFEVDDVSDDPNGKPEDGADSERIATFPAGDRPITLSLERSRLAPRPWLFSRGTQSHIPELYARYLPSPLEKRVPRELKSELLGMPYWQWLGVLGAAVVAFGLGSLLARSFKGIGVRLARRTRVLWDDELVPALFAPSRLLWTVVVYVPLAHALSLPGDARAASMHVVATLGICALAWSLIRVLGVVSNVMERRAAARSQGESRSSLRVARTQVRILRRVLNALVCACTLAVLMLQFEVVRNVGVSLLASAGVAGVVLGFAAQRTLSSVFAGVQLSITQPISLGDEVVVEGEFGTIEEITLTYVVVRLWDERRLIVPITRFLEQPFQNWTKVSQRMHGAVLLQVDFALPIAALRAELARLLEHDPNWDGRTQAVHATDAHERTLEVRVLVSAEDGGKLFELRAALREKLAAWLAGFEGGRYLPRARSVNESDARPAPP